MELLRAHLTRVDPSRLTSTHVADVVHLAAEVLSFATGELAESLHKRLDGVALALASRASIGHGSRDVGHSGRGQLVTSFAHDGVNEVSTTEGACNEGSDILAAWGADLHVASDVSEDLVVAEVDQGQLTLENISLSSVHRLVQKELTQLE